MKLSLIEENKGMPANGNSLDAMLEAELELIELTAGARAQSEATSALLARGYVARVFGIFRILPPGRRWLNGRRIEARSQFASTLLYEFQRLLGDKPC